jgi:predicted Zn-dependent protease
VVSNRESQLAEPRAGDEQALSKRRALRLYGLEIIEIVNRLPLSARDSDRWKFQWGSLLRKTRQFERAIALLEPLAQRFHGDLKIQQEFARALSATKSPTRQPDALKAWRRLAKSLTPATENWYEARLNVARQLQSSGDREGAKKLLLFTRSVYGWDDTAWRDDLGRLLRELRTLSTP